LKKELTPGEELEKNLEKSQNLPYQMEFFMHIEIESWSTYYETKANDFYADKADGATETTKTQFDIALLREQQVATRALIEAKKEFEKAHDEAKANDGFVRYDVLEWNFPDRLDDGYGESHKSELIENVDRDRI